jgi:hypothetical protein
MERLEMLKLPSKFIKPCHNQANIGLRNMERLDCLVPPMAARDSQG